MAQMRKSALQRYVRQRNKAYDTLEFNKKYPEVAAELLDEAHLKEQKQLELQSKKRLLPLEIAALSPADRNLLQQQRELADLDRAQELTRRAAKQTSLRRAKRIGEAEAQAAYERTVQTLTAQKEATQAALAQKYPAGATSLQPADALLAYQQASQEEEAKMAALKARQAADKEARLSAIKRKLTAQNLKLQEAFDANNARLIAASSQEKSSFDADSILSIRNLKMYFSGIKAVDDLSFDVKEGEIFGLIGPNGAGKTTVFNCVTRFYNATEGQMYYRDRFSNIVSLADYDTPDVIKLGISRTFQNLELVHWLSILDNLLVGAHAFYRANLADQFLRTSRLKREEEVFRQRAIELLDRLGIAQYKDLSPYGLPYGILKKVELARTLMSNPKLIILDEPAAGLNDAETEDLAQIIKLIRDDFDCTIFLVEHDMNLVMEVCDTVCAISFGKKLALGTPEEIQNSPLVQEAYLGTE